MALKITKINRRVRIYVRGHGYFEAGQEKELDKLIDDREKQIHAQKRQVEVSGEPGKAAKSASKKSEGKGGASASGDDNS